jgi:hypothetical protein
MGVLGTIIIAIFLLFAACFAFMFGTVMLQTFLITRYLEIDGMAVTQTDDANDFRALLSTKLIEKLHLLAYRGERAAKGLLDAAIIAKSSDYEVVCSHLQICRASTKVVDGELRVAPSLIECEQQSPAVARSKEWIAWVEFVKEWNRLFLFLHYVAQYSPFFRHLCIAIPKSPE